MDALELATDDDLLDYVHKTHNTVYHPAATARMGAVDDPMAVLDPQLRVHGLEHLYVVDASFLPSSTAVNPSLTIVAQAVRTSDHLLKDVFKTS